MSIEAAARRLVSIGSGTSMDFLGFSRAFEELSEIVRATPPTIAVAEHPLRRAAQELLESAPTVEIEGKEWARLFRDLREALDRPSPAHLTDGERRALWKYINATRLDDAERELISSARKKLS